MPKEHLRNRWNYETWHNLNMAQAELWSMAQPKHGTSWMKLVGNGCKKAKHHLNRSSGKPKNATFTTPTHGAERAPSKPVKLWSMTQPEHGTSWMKLVGNGCKKAKHHLNRSSRKPKNATFTTPTHGAERAPSKPLKLWSMAQPEHGTSWIMKHGTTWPWHKLNEARRQRMQKS